MLSCENFAHLKKAVQSRINNESDDTIKQGAGIKYQYAILDAAISLRDHYTCSREEDADKNVEQLRKFLEFYKSAKRLLFGEVDAINLERRAENRMASNLPTTEEVKVVLKCCDQIIASTLSKRSISGDEYVSLYCPS